MGRCNIFDDYLSFHLRKLEIIIHGDAMREQQMSRTKHCSVSKRVVKSLLIIFAINTEITVVPAKAGIHSEFAFSAGLWIPAFAGTTVRGRAILSKYFRRLA
jgi:hypothetical protein